MKKVLLLILLSVNAVLFAQKKPEVSLALLGNDKITEVNLVDQERFLDNVKETIDAIQNEFSEINDSQKIAVYFNFHKTGQPTIEIYSDPKISIEKQKKCLEIFRTIKFENTKLVDFPMVYLLNTSFDKNNTGFKDFVYPGDKIRQEYEKADLKTKTALNKAFAIEVLQILSAYETKVDDKFAGVKNFGKLVEKTNFNNPQDISKLTSNNSDYWRATMEMSQGNHLIPITKAFMLTSQGEFDYAFKYLELLKIFSDKDSSVNSYLVDLYNRIYILNESLNLEIQKGIAEHDKENYEKAIAIYTEILNNYPNSAWAKYELYYSQNTLNLETKKTDLDNRKLWDKSKTNVYKSNPLYPMDIRASSGKEYYLLSRRMSISNLFKDEKKFLDDVVEYANIASDLEVYDFAAQFYWITLPHDKNVLSKYLYCLEKLGAPKMKENFKGDFKKEFRKLETEKEKRITESEEYKTFKD